MVCLHAHPDDEALYTGGTMARLAAEGHRVVLVTATAGEAGLASPEAAGSGDLGDVRMAELAASAEILGCARVLSLGYADSGMADHPVATDAAFAKADVEVAATALSRILTDEDADALTVYDPAGGYGHPDHVQVHRVGSLAARMAGTRVTLEATVDRRALQRALRLVSWSTRNRPELAPSAFDQCYSHPAGITHRVDVAPFLDQKRASMAAHWSQTTGGDVDRTLAWSLRLPRPLFRLVFGREWFVEQGRDPVRRPLDDVLASLR